MKIRISVSVLMSFMLIVGSVTNVDAQNSKRIELEREIKTKPNYIYMQSVQGDTVKGKILAADLFWSSENIKNELSSNKTLKKDNIEYIIKPRGPKYMIITYIDKTSKGVISTPKNESKTTTGWKLNMPVENAKGTESVATPAEEKLKIISKSVIKNEDSVIDKKEIAEKPATIVVEKSITINEKNNDEIFQTSSAILNHLAKLSGFNDIVGYLKEQKMKGKLVYSYRYDAFKDNIKECYFIVFSSNTDELLMILDKGTTSRMNVLNSKMVSISESKNEKKIYVYEF
ncbi:hypothetical protein ACXR6G_18270 [Ancylomarina sp. YFZ004]